LTTVIQVQKEAHLRAAVEIFFLNIFPSQKVKNTSSALPPAPFALKPSPFNSPPVITPD